jgi:hypothetical protein
LSCDFLSVYRFNYHKSLMQIIVFHGSTWNFNKIDIWFSYILFFRLPFMYCIYYISFIGRDVRKSNIDFIEISCTPMKNYYLHQWFVVVKSVNGQKVTGMVFIATFKMFTVIWWLSVLSLQYISNFVSFW